MAGLAPPKASLPQRLSCRPVRRHRHGVSLGDENPLQVALHGLDGGHDDRIKARAEELLSELSPLMP
jgi:hypothetical protein